MSLPHFNTRFYEKKLAIGDWKAKKELTLAAN